MSNKTPQEKSHHIFIFPFKWNYKPKDREIKNTAFSTRTSLKYFGELIENLSQWKKNPFKFKSPSDYNDYVYFYDFAREALFQNENSGEVLLQYEFKLKDEEKPVYKIKRLNSEIIYELDIEKILLTVYFTGVGILSFHLNNNKYLDLNDILQINEFGRRIYPQFLSEPKPEKKKESDVLTTTAKKSFLADSLEVCVNDKLNFKEDFNYYNSIYKVNENPNRLSDTIVSVLGKDVFYTDCKNKKKELIHISPILDDRMFVLCWLADENLCPRLSEYNEKGENYAYTNSDDWYKLIFIDHSDPSCKSIPMKRRLLLEHTYDRWIEYNSLYGITRYSFILLNDKESIFENHIKTMYFRMVKLVLVQRASILCFSGEASRISDLKESKNLTEQISELQKKYLQFINRIYFREITAQEQGIELYDKIIQAMQIERDIKALDQEIGELHNYASLQKDEANNELLRVISIIGALFLIPAFITGFFGMNIFSDKLIVDPKSMGRLWIILGTIISVCFISWLLIIKNKKKWVSFVLGVLGLFGIALTLGLISGCLFKLFRV